MNIVSNKREVIDGGFVQLLDVMGSDSEIARAAMVTRMGEKAIDVTKDNTQNLLRHMVREGHWSPFEMAELKFFVRVPMDTWRQWIRHRTASVCEYSTRYKDAILDTSTDNLEDWRTQNIFASFTEEQKKNFSKKEQETFSKSREVYNQLLKGGVEKGQARKVLPLATFTEAVWKIDLRNLFHFLKLRMGHHAQLEIRLYALEIANIVREYFPLSYDAFADYDLNCLVFNDIEQKLVRKLFRQELSREDIVAGNVGNELTSEEKHLFADKILCLT